MGINAFRQRVTVYATDVDEEALNLARQASYAAKDLEPVDVKLRDKYFEPMNGRYIFRADLRRSVIFGRHDLVQDAPISRLDLLISRNAIIYFNSETQARILGRFHFSLNETGYLFLGRAELLLSHSHLFTPLDLKHRVFAKLASVNMRDRLVAADQIGNHEINPIVGPLTILQEAALDASPIARILVDANGNLVHADQKARLLFTLNPKDVGRPLQDLEISYRPVELRSLIEEAHTERRTVTLTSMERHFPTGEIQYLDVVVTPLYDRAHVSLGVGISFSDVTVIHKLKEDLQRSREEIQTANEELQSSKEELELHSSTEELQTTNEELQSTNEELETMNEELQSTNEELHTVNEQLRQLSDELNRANAFLKSVLASLRSGAIVINENLNILVWNHRAEDLWGLREDETKGQSLLTLDIGLPVHQLRPILRACLSGEADHKEILLDATNRRGKPIKCRIACTPLLAPDNHRHGAILLMDESEKTT
jgi:two-component system CheB/CheR fusion protein